MTTAAPRDGDARLACEEGRGLCGSLLRPPLGNTGPRIGHMLLRSIGGWVFGL